MVQRELTDERWTRITPHLPQPKRSRKGGRPPKGNRECFEGLLWILRTGARWKDMPDCFPSGSTCWRRLRDWDACGAWEAAWHTFLAELGEQDPAMWEAAFADAIFVPAKKGATALAKPSAAKERSWWWWVAARAFLWHSPSRRPRRRRPR
jgi:transposase